MFMLLIGSMLACESGKSTETGDSGDPGENPYEMPDVSGCTRTISTYDGPDGVLQDESVVVFGEEERVESYGYQDRVEGIWYEGAYTYDERGCVLGWTYATGTEGFTQLEMEEAYTCAADGTWTESTTVYTWYDGEDEVIVTTQPSTWSYVWSGDHIVRRDEVVTQSTGEFIQQLYTAYAWDGKVIEASTTEDRTTTVQVYTRDEHGRISERATIVDGEAQGTARYSWEDAHYRLQQYTWDDGDDGALDMQYDYVCAGEWPWSCSISMDLGDEDGGPIDGVADSIEAQTWTCP